MIGFCRALQGQQNITVAGRPLREFGAKMQTYPAFSQEIDAEIFQGARRSTITPLSNRRGAKYLRCLIDFFGDNAARTANQSAFEALFLGLQPVELDIGDGFFYRAVLTGQGETVALGEILTTVEYTFRLTRHRTPQALEIVGYDNVTNPTGGIVFCQSNVEQTDCVVKMSLGITGINRNLVVRRLDPKAANPHTAVLQDWSYSGDIQQDIVLDGLRKIFLVDGVNMTNKVVWTDFPYLEPGVNLFTCALDGVFMAQPFTVEYTPTYL